MKKILIIFTIASASFLTSCDKDPDPVSKLVDVSYPTITLRGSPVIHIPIGGSYTDEGAILIDDITGAQSDIMATSNEVDNTTVGIYAIRYIAKNANGFLTETDRYVLVLDYTPPVGLDPNFDLSGSYLRTATGVVNNVYKVDNGLYIMDNMGGSSLAVPAYMLTPDTNTIDIPLQVSDGLELDCTSETYVPAGANPAQMKWVVDASGFGTALRTFTKQ